MPRLLDEVTRRTGLGEEAAARAVRAAAELLAAALDDAAREDLVAAAAGAAAPGTIDLSALSAPPLGGELTLDHLGLRVAYALALAPRRALEVAEVAGQALFSRVPEKTRARARSLLHPSLRALLEPPPSVAAPEAEGAAPVTGAGHKLASGRQGSHRPLAETRPPPGHTHSVARTAEPHAERSLSSGAPDADRSHDTLAEGRPGSKRPLSTGGRE